MISRSLCVLAASATKCGVTLMVVLLSPLVILLTTLAVVPYVVWLIWCDGYTLSRQSEAELELAAAHGPV